MRAFTKMPAHCASYAFAHHWQTGRAVYPQHHLSGAGGQEFDVELSRETRLFAGLSLLAVPTIMYGGLTLLGVLTKGGAGMAPAGLELNETQWALFRAGHAHAGVWIVLSLVLQVLLDSATLRTGLKRLARISAPVAAVAISGGFFGVAFLPAFRLLLYFGAASLAVAVVLTGVGLIRRPFA
jgi:hypothetical protein